MQQHLLQLCNATGNAHDPGSDESPDYERHLIGTRLDKKKSVSFRYASGFGEGESLWHKVDPSVYVKEGPVGN